MRLTHFLILVPGLLAGHCVLNCAEPAAEPGWPQVNGPFGNFNPRRYGVKLVDDLSQARAVWTSEQNDLGYGKTSSSGFVGNRATWPGHPGSASGLIAADGKIFASSFRPAGEVWAESFAKGRGDIMSQYSPEQQKSLRRALSIDADDFVVAIDMASGKTAWKTVEEGKGLFRGMGKRSGWGVTPAYYDGKVFSMGTTGRLYCYDARTGKKVWETDIGKTHQAWEAEKKKHLEEKSLASGGQYVSLIVADGVLIVPLYDAGDMALRGVDTAAGKTLWEVPAATAGTATPALWRHEGRQYVLAATHGGGDHRQGKLRLIDAKDGKVLWTVEKLGNTHFALAPSDKHVLVNVTSKTQGWGEVPWMLLGCYRLSLQGATLAWTMPDELELWHEARYEASDWRKYLILDGKVYYYSRSRNPDRSDVGAFFIFDEETGKVLYRRRGRGEADVPMPGQHYLIEDRLLQIPDASHGTRVTLRLWTADPENLRPLCAPWASPHPGTTAYNVFMEFPYVDGRIFMRAQDGTVRCYDLRKP
jgi:outer membrane protein assembly factor BamB